MDTAMYSKCTQNVEYVFALLYRKDSKFAHEVAKLCDEELDKSEALLGRVRKVARMMSLSDETYIDEIDWDNG